MGDHSRGQILQRARPAIKATVRGLGIVSAPWRTDPDFLVIGSKRGGSTSLYFDLLDHPDILPLFPPPVPVLKPDATKGVHYFDSNYWRGERWYRSHMPTSVHVRRFARRTGVQPRVGEASPYYLFHPAAASRAHATIPRAKIIALLRNPVDRTYSHWKERRRQDAEHLGFAEALAAEPRRLAGERERLLADPRYTSYAWEQQSYASQSRYGAALQPWIAHYGRDRVFVAASEDYYRDPIALLASVDSFLGIPPRSGSTGVVRNAARGEDLDEALRARLRVSFEEDVALLQSLTEQTFPWS